MFVSPFTVSVSCDAAIIVIYLQRTGEFGGSSWFGIEDGHGFTTEVVDLVWLAILRIAFLLPHILEFLKRRRLSCPGFHHSFVVANFFFVAAKAIAILVDGPAQSVAFFWWLLVVLSAVSIVAQRGCLHHLRSTMPTPRYKTIFIGSRLDARLLDDQYGYDTASDDEDYYSDDSEDSSAEDYGGGGVIDGSLEAGERGSGSRGGGGSEESKGTLGITRGPSRQYPKTKVRRPRSGSRGTVSTARRGRRRRRRGRSRSRSSRQESTRELVDFFADRMQEARDAWSERVSTLKKRWQASFLRGDGWGMRGGGSPAADRDAALRLTFGLIVRMYAYDDALQDLAEQDPICLEAFAPQFASFLVWDSYYMSGQMEAWLLARCSENLYFAHALEFQLRASCLPPITAVATTSAPSSSTGALGGDAAGSPAATGGGTSPSSHRPSATRRSSSGLDLVASGGGGAGDGEDDGGGGAAIDRVGRRAIELLLQEIAQTGERAARRLVEEAKAIAAGGVRGDAVGDGGGDTGSGSPGLVPGQVGGGTATPAVAGGSEEFGGKEQSKSEDGVAVGGDSDGGVGGREGEKQAPILYRQTIDFLARLADIASSLTPLSKAERTPLLKEQLRDVGSKFLGAGGGERLVYVPVGGRHHRVVAVHPSESFAFSTRERAPCFICLEVVGAKEPALQRRPWWRQDGLSDDGDNDNGQTGGEVEEQGGNMLSRRMQALRQWLPSGVSLKQRFRLLPGSTGGGGGGGGGRSGWRLFVGTEDADHDDTESGGAVRSGEGRAGASTGGGGGTLEDLERGESGSNLEGRSRSAVGEGGVSISRDGSRRGGGGGDERYDSGAEHYRLLPEETGEIGAEASGRGSGDGSPLSSTSGDSREWWTASNSGIGRPWGGEDDVGDNALADVSSSALRKQPVEAETAAAAAAGRERRAGDNETGDDSRKAEAGAAAAASAAAPSQPQVLFNELWQDKSNRIRMVSPWAGEPGWRLLPVIVKANDDLRQEQLASQLLFVMQRILRAEGVRAWLRPYDIVALSADTGIVEAVPDTISLDALRRYRRRGSAAGGDAGDASSSGAASRFSLAGFFEARFGAKGSEGFRQAQQRFIESLAAYSIACYLLQIKDRHNGNILLDAQGHVIHVDFGFMLANSPGGNLGFESAPFKLTQGFLNLMGGTQSRCFWDFQELCVDTFLALRRSSQEIVLLVEMMASGNETLPCFQGPGGGAAAAAELAARFQPDLNDPACKDFVHKLCAEAAGSWTTAWYDKYQRLWSGIY
eukprot:g12689.t1